MAGTLLLLLKISVANAHSARTGRSDRPHNRTDRRLGGSAGVGTGVGAKGFGERRSRAKLAAVSVGGLASLQLEGLGQRLERGY